MFRFTVDTSQIAEMARRAESELIPALQRAVGDLSMQTHAHVLEKVQNSLHSSREIYVNALHYNVVDENTYVINLDRAAWWIEDGITPGTEMIDWLLRQASPNSKPPKTAKDGCVLNPKHKILTTEGWKKIKDIKKGDMVLTHSGKFREVKELLVRPTGVGTEYITIYPRSVWKSSLSKENHDLTYPTLTLTLDHKVLTPNGWVEAGTLKKGDLVATPADLKRLCLDCGQPLPINCHDNQYCLNNKCSRRGAIKQGRMLGKMTKEERTINSKKGNRIAKESGCFDRPDWGARNPETLHKLRKASNDAMRQRISDGQWAPEVFFESLLSKEGIKFEREKPIQTDRVVSAGKGRTRKSIMYCDFFIPALNLVIELDGKKWHAQEENIQRDIAKNEACERMGWKMMRIPSHEIYAKGQSVCESLKLWMKNHSGELGIAWVDVMRVKKGVVPRKDHIFAKKYDICLEAEEHSFCCETVMIHNSTYRVIPFMHNKGPTSQTPTQNLLKETIRKELRSRGIPYGNLELDTSGKPKIGKLHSFDIMNKPVKTAHGVGQGWGDIGKPRVGATGIPFLQGVTIYQRAYKDAAGNNKVRKDIMTFRVVSSKHKGTGRWVHPGFESKEFLKEGYEWAKKEWDDKYIPQILATLGG